MQWKKICSENDFPPKDGPYLCVLDKVKKIRVLFYRRIHGRQNRIFFGPTSSPRVVTHWMELPALPEDMHA